MRAGVATTCCLRCRRRCGWESVLMQTPIRIPFLLTTYILADGVGRLEQETEGSLTGLVPSLIFSRPAAVTVGTANDTLGYLALYFSQGITAMDKLAYLDSFTLGVSVVEL